MVGVPCNIEMQVVNQHNIEKRCLFYWAKAYAKTIRAGIDYSDLKKTIAVLFADFEIDGLKDLKKSFSHWNIREKEYREIMLTDVLQIYIIELPKVEKYKDLDNNLPLKLWVKFIENPEDFKMSEYENDEACKETIEAIENAKNKLDEISQDEHERYIAELREKYILDQRNIENYGYKKGKAEGIAQGKAEGIAQGIEQGKAEGIAQGKTENTIAIVKKMLKKKMDIDVIADITGISKDEIEKIIAEQ